MSGGAARRHDRRDRRRHRHRLPARERRAAGAVATEGLLIAEQPPGTEPRARHFPYRNRIIAGLAQGTVVVEAAPKSGSLITARLATEAGREVMAVPGSPARSARAGLQPADPRRRDAGPVRRRRDGALAPDRRARRARMSAAATDAGAAGGRRATSDAAARITDLLGPVPVAVDELIRQSDCRPRWCRRCCWSWNWPGGWSGTPAGEVSLR